jgi:hypothetical protein
MDLDSRILVPPLAESFLSPLIQSLFYHHTAKSIEITHSTEPNLDRKSEEEASDDSKADIDNPSDPTNVADFSDNLSDLSAVERKDSRSSKTVVRGASYSCIVVINSYSFRENA